jgi:hypothetical protein
LFGVLCALHRVAEHVTDIKKSYADAKAGKKDEALEAAKAKKTFSESVSAMRVGTL